MNKRQRFVLLAGIILLVLNFVFPFSSRPVIEWSEDGRSVRSTVRTGFMPIWQVNAEHEKATVEGNMFGDTFILWHWVWLLATVIVVVCGWWLIRLRCMHDPHA